MPAINPTERADRENAYQAWRFAADEAAHALRGWISGPCSARAAAFYIRFSGKIE